MGSPGQLGPTPKSCEQTWVCLTPLLLLSCFVLSPQQHRVPGAWTVPCSAGSSARQAQVPAGPACPPSRRTTAGAVSRGSSHPVVGAPTLHPSACTPTLHLCSSGRFCASGQPPTPAAPHALLSFHGSCISVGTAALLPLTPLTSAGGVVLGWQPHPALRASCSCDRPCQHCGEPRTCKDRSRAGSFWGSLGYSRSAWLFQGSGFAGAGEPSSAHRAVTYAAHGLTHPRVPLGFQCPIPFGLRYWSVVQDCCFLLHPCWEGWSQL